MKYEMYAICDRHGIFQAPMIFRDEKEALYQLKLAFRKEQIDPEAVEGSTLYHVGSFDICDLNPVTGSHAVPVCNIADFFKEVNNA